MIRRVALFLVLAILLTGCAGQRPSRYSRMYYDAFDTVIQLTVYAQAEPDFSAFEAELWRLDAVFDRYAEHPGICGLWALNASGGDWLEIEPELYELLTLCKQWWEKYGDRVNPGMGEVISLWAEYREAGEGVPSDRELSQAAEHSDFSSLELSEGRARLTDPEMTLDLGASAKGYAAGVLQETLLEEYDSFLLDMGGNITACGEKADGSGSWQVGVRAPETGGILLTMRMEDLSASTSAGDQRYYEWNGVRYHHLLDPETLYPANFVRQVTVLSENAALADYFSTLLFVTPVERALALAESVPEIGAIFVLNDGSVQMTGNAEKWVEE